ncbi:MFS transporter [Chitinophaga filiformis]|uniref:MFS transporter, DHA2 family, multidrug resistance protein n=1 Tax=Chitinophaga filiformis TaxID=104663 RepID=A0A1G7SB52_CHIFI|nr:MFS transporter [Chitinophaga filiformis]SDG20276.1 MFS transporter, DHA2 family, multidrug resistance protein [Chitinophaga filiformis]
MKPVYFKPWIKDWEWGVRIALFLILLSSLMQLGLFAMTQQYIVAYLGSQPEDVWFCLMSTYAGIISILPVQFRFLRYFEVRSYLAFNIMLAMLLNCLCLFCQDITLLFLIRFLQGLVLGSLIVSVLILIFSRVPVERAPLIGAAVLYPTILSNIVVAGLFAGFVVESANWEVIYYYLIGIQLLMLIMTLLMLRRHTGHRRFPLYQIDWAGFILLACSALSLAYTFIYGSKFYWFADPRIRVSATIAGISIPLFLYRQHIVKRKLIHPGVFKSVHFVTALCLLAVYYGTKDSINLVYNYASGVLRWSPFQVGLLGVCNIAAMACLTVFSARAMIAGKYPVRFFLVTGFSLLAMFNIWMWLVLTPDLSYTDLLLPVLLQGAASGILFVPIMIYILKAAPGFSGTSGIVLAACTRFFVTLNSLAGLYNLQLYFNQYFKEGFLGYMTIENQNVTGRLNAYRSLYVAKGFSAEQGSGLANGAIWQNLLQQSQLLTNRAVFMTFAIILMVTMVLCLVVPAVRETLQHRRKRLLVKQ